MTRETLKDAIKTAFGSVPFPSHQGLRGSMAMDDYATDGEVKSITTEQDVHGEWWQIPREELRSCRLALCYLDAAGVLFYLPAYLYMALDDIDKRELAVLDLVDVTLGNDDHRLRAYLEERLSRLDDEQRRICLRSLQFLRSQLPIDDPATEYARQHVDRVLNDPYWRDAY